MKFSNSDNIKSSAVLHEKQLLHLDLRHPGEKATEETVGNIWGGLSI